MNVDVRLGPWTVPVEDVPPDLVAELRRLFRWPVEEVPAGRAAAPGAFRVVVSPGPVPAIPSGPRHDLGLEFDEVAVEAVEDGVRRIWPAATGGHVTVDARPEAGTVTVGVVRNDRHGVVDLYRVLRQLFLARAAITGHVPVHSAAVVIDGRGVLLVGDKGSGKTTTSAQLALLGAGHLANDKILLGADGLMVHFPEAPAVTRATVELVGLADRYEALRAAGRFDACRSFLDHPAPAPLDTLDPQRKVYFSEREYAALLGTTEPVTAPLALVVDLAGEPGGTELETHRDELEPFPDWLGVRPGFGPVPRVMAETPWLRGARRGTPRDTAAAILDALDRLPVR